MFGFSLYIYLVLSQDLKVHIGYDSLCRRCFHILSAVDFSRDKIVCNQSLSQADVLKTASKKSKKKKKETFLFCILRAESQMVKKPGGDF